MATDKIPFDWHPAVYSKVILDDFRDIIQDKLDQVGAMSPIRVLDPFAGTGKIHVLASPDVQTFGIEIQPQWAALHEHTAQGDATRLPGSMTNFFDMVMTSPAYGNRFSDKHNAKDGSKRRSYTHDLRRMTGDPTINLEPNNTGGYAFHTRKYKELHQKAWQEVWRVLKPGGWFVLNVSDSIKLNEVIEVCQWHLDACTDIGFDVRATHEIATRRLRYGANATARPAYEMVYVMTKKEN